MKCIRLGSLALCAAIASSVYSGPAMALSEEEILSVCAGGEAACTELMVAEIAALKQTFSGPVEQEQALASLVSQFLSASGLTPDASVRAAVGSAMKTAANSATTAGLRSSIEASLRGGDCLERGQRYGSCRLSASGTGIANVIKSRQGCPFQSAIGRKFFRCLWW